jgi:subtilisin family serine protease
MVTRAVVFLYFFSFFLVALCIPEPKDGRYYLGVPVSNPDAKDVVPNKYLVVYNNTVSDNAVKSHQSSIINTISKRNIGKRSPVDGRRLSTQVKTFSISGWRAMSLEADDVMMIEIFEAKEVSFIEQDTYIKINVQNSQTNAPPGLARLSSSVAVSNNNTYTFDSTGGQGITVFVVDTGIRTTHSEFEGRATFGANFVNNVVSDTSPIEDGHNIQD